MRPSSVFVDFGSGMDDPFRPSVDPVGQPKEAVRRRRIDHQPPRDERLVVHCFTRFHPCKIRRTFSVLLSMMANCKNNGAPRDSFADDSARTNLQQAFKPKFQRFFERPTAVKPLSLARLGMAELVSSKPCSERDIVLAIRTRRNARKGPGFRRADSPCGTGAGACRRSPRSAAPRSKRAESRSRWTRSRPRIRRRCFGCCRRNLQYGAVFPETGTRIGRAEMRPHRSNKGPPASGEVRLSAGTSG